MSTAPYRRGREQNANDDEYNDDSVVGAVLAAMETILAPYLKNPCRTSVLTGALYYAELCAGNERRFQEQARMSKAVFSCLLADLEGSGAIKGSRLMSVGEKLLIGLYILGGKSNRDAQERWQQSGETITRVIREVTAAILGLQTRYVIHRPPESLNDKFLPYVEHCIGALDGTHIKFLPRGIDSRAFRNRKVQNVLALCNFELSFFYVLAGWEGSARDGRVLRDAWIKGLKCGEGKFYLGDAGYSLTKNVLTPYRGVRCHLKEWEKATSVLKTKKSYSIYGIRLSATQLNGRSG